MSVRQEDDDTDLNEKNNACDSEPEKDFIRRENAHPRCELRMLCRLTGHRKWLIAPAKARLSFGIMTDVRRLTERAWG